MPADNGDPSFKNKEMIMKVGEYCNRQVVIVEKTDSILEATRIMRKHHVGTVVVVEYHGELRIPVGILTDRDIVVELLAVEVEVHSVNVGDVMSGNLITVEENDDMMTTVKRMKAKGIRRVPVVNPKGGLEGILSMDDIMELLAEQMGDLSALISREQTLEREKFI